MKGSTPTIKTRKSTKSLSMKEEPLCQGGNVQFINIMTENMKKGEDISVIDQNAMAQFSLINDVSKQSHKLLRRDLTVVNEIKATNSTSVSERSTTTYQTLDERKRDVINRVTKQAKLLRETNN